MQQLTNWGTWMRYRIGILYNQEDDCGTPDSAQGVGGEVTWVENRAQPNVAAGAWVQLGHGHTVGSLYPGSVAGVVRVYVGTRAGPPPLGDCDPNRNASALLWAPVAPVSAAAPASGGQSAATAVTALVAAAAVGGAALAYRQSAPPPAAAAAGGIHGDGSPLQRSSRSRVGRLLSPLTTASVLSANMSSKPCQQRPPSIMHRLLMMPSPPLPRQRGRLSVMYRLMLPDVEVVRAPILSSPAPLAAASGGDSGVTAIFPATAAAVIVTLPPTAACDDTAPPASADEAAAAPQAAPVETAYAEEGAEDAVGGTKATAVFALANPLQAAAVAQHSASSSSSTLWARASSTKVARGAGGTSSPACDGVTQDCVFMYVAGQRIARVNSVGVVGGLGNGFSPIAVKALPARLTRARMNGDV